MQKGEDSMSSIYDVAEWFLQKQPMNHKKLQKMCYYAYSWHLALHETKLFDDSSFQAWVHGPVSPKLYDLYKGNGWIDLPAEGRQLQFSPKELDLLESVYLTYGNSSANALEVLSHSERPWKRAREGCAPDERSTNEIDDNDIIEYYLSIYEGDDA